MWRIVECWLLTTDFTCKLQLTISRGEQNCFVCLCIPLCRLMNHSIETRCESVADTKLQYSSKFSISMFVLQNRISRKKNRERRGRRSVFRVYNNSRHRIFFRTTFRSVNWSIAIYCRKLRQLIAVSCSLSDNDVIFKCVCIASFANCRCVKRWEQCISWLELFMRRHLFNALFHEPYWWASSTRLSS